MDILYLYVIGHARALPAVPLLQEIILLVVLLKYYQL